VPHVRRLVDEFDVLTAAPGGIGRVRELIIELAVRGRLVPQRRGDAPATGLVTKARKVLEAAQKRRVLQDLPPEPHSLPGGWVWCQPQDIGTIAPRNEASDDAEVGFVPMTAVPTDYREGAASEVRRWGDIKKGYTHIADGDVVVAKITPCFQNKKSCVMDGLRGGIGAGTTELLVLRLVKDVAHPKYLLLFFKSPSFILGGVERMTGTAGQQRVPLDYFAAVPLPLPPLAEQQRIVAKVDELMRLLDNLEVLQVNQRQTQTRLRSAALGSLTFAERAAEVVTAWSRVAENFEVLFDRPESVGELRSHILDLAIRGALNGPRDDLAPCPRGAPFALPRGWRWARLGELCERITKGSSPRWQGIRYVTPHDGILFVTSENVGSGRLLLDRPKYVERRFNEIEPRSVLRRGDLLMNIVGASIGRVAIFDRNDIANVNQAVCIIRLTEEAVVPSFILLFLNSPTCIACMFDKQVDNARANLSMGNIGKFLIPLPPAEEQRRIVAKVEQLMKLCDDLEAKLRQAEETAGQLLQAVMAEMATSSPVLTEPSAGGR
jgi:type I restriction enzyme S subunit